MGPLPLFLLPGQFLPTDDHSSQPERYLFSRGTSLTTLSDESCAPTHCILSLYFSTTSKYVIYHKVKPGIKLSEGSLWVRTCTAPHILFHSIPLAISNSYYHFIEGENGVQKG